MKTLIIVLLSWIIGAISAFIFIYYFFESEASDFMESQIATQERISVDAFNHYPLETSNFIQINYSIFLKEANDAGLVSDLEYHRAALLANTRLCISYENLGEDKEAALYCKWAKDHLSKWDEKMDFTKFKREQLEARTKKETPLFSQSIITNNE